MLRRCLSVSTYGGLCLGLCLLVFGARPAAAQTLSDRQALMDLYNATNGANWINNTGWGTAAPINDWYGITQSASGDGEWALAIDLRANNLSGQVPATWSTAILDGAFRDLQHLILDDNPISGSILPEYGALGNLHTLSFNSTNLSGSIPSALSELQNLEFLSFFNNSLSGTIPEGIFSIPTLRTFQVTLNQLSGSLPTGISNNESLFNLRLGFNNFSGPIPPDIADGASLEVLILSENGFSGDIPAQLGGSTSLRQLNLSNNPNLTPGPIPPELATLSSLEVLDLALTNRDGAIPSEFGNLVRLRVFDVQGNAVDGPVPAAFAGLESLEEFSATDNFLTDLPDMSGIPSLVTLHVAGNFFEFDDLLPHQGVQTFEYSPQRPFGAPQAVGTGAGGIVTLDAFPAEASGNAYQWQLDGASIPGANSVTYTIENAEAADSGIYTLSVTNSALPALTLTSHEIDVSIEGGQATDRDALVALYNSMNGDNWTNNTNWLSSEPVSEWYGVTESSQQPGGVDILDLRNNNLAGQIPSGWGTMISDEGVFANLTRLDLSGNVVTGFVPSFLGGLTALQELVLSNNALQGIIPVELAGLENLMALRLDGNSLSGDVPVEFNSMPSLVELDIQANFLENLPDFSNAPSLQILDARNNRFQFDDLEPNVQIAEFSYIPQLRFGETDGFSVAEGNNLSLSFTVGGSNNEYQWLLNSTPIQGATGSQYQITGAGPEDEGSYTLQVTSSLLPELVLESNTLFVDVTSGGTQSEFVVTNTNDSGPGSLRAAIEAANANLNGQTVLDEITFEIPGTGPHVIRPLSALPDITESVILSAHSQSGASCGSSTEPPNLQIILDGSDAGLVDGGITFREITSTAIVSGFVIHNFDGAGIHVESSPAVFIQCNYIGTDRTGTSALPNVDGIVSINSANTIVGGDSQDAGNLISGNTDAGIRFEGGANSGSGVVYGNLIGTNAAGNAVIPNSIGVAVLNSPSTVIGSPGVSQQNIISGNTVRGVDIAGTGATGTFMVNNIIGTDQTGTIDLGNGEGIRIRDGASQSTIGIETFVSEAGYTNRIAANTGKGIVIEGNASTGNRISANQIYENGGLGIDLGDDGQDLNDVGDGDSGPNNRMNSPELVASVIDANGDLIVDYRVDATTTNANYLLRIEFFSADVDGEEGARQVGFDDYFLNEAQQVVQVNLGNADSLNVFDAGNVIATATDNFGNTSEFSGAGSGPGGGNQFTVTQPGDVAAFSGGDVQLQATVPSGYNPTVRDVCYRRTGEAEFTCTQLQANGGGYQGAIPSSFVTERGVQYYYRFSDGTTETTVPETDPETSPFVLEVRVTNIAAGGSFSPDTYRMITIPLEITESAFTRVLSDYGPIDPRRWRLLRWDPSVEDYEELPELSGNFDPCDAYWLITFDGAAFEVDEATSVDYLEPCFVSLRPGWNQFGSPYAFAVAWADVDFSGTLDGPVLYDASAGEEDPYVYDVQVLEPWQGYWVFNPGTSNVSLSFNPIEAVGKAGKSDRGRHLAADEYELRLRASVPEHGLVDSRNHVGLTERASDGFDELDFAEAPPIGDHVRLSIIEDDMRLAGSFRPLDDRGQSWDLRITSVVNGSPASGIVRVSIDEFGPRPDGFDLRVVDLDSEQPVRLDDEGFEIEITRSRPVRNLRLILGTAAFSEEAGESIPEVPQRAELAQNYPNPFNPSTRIRYQVHVDGPIEISVFDPLGRRISTLVDADREPGWYETTWDGRDESGVDVSSGMYFYVLKTIDGSVSRTMVLLR